MRRRRCARTACWCAAWMRYGPTRAATSSSTAPTALATS
jgi:hypothetical protein